MKKICFLVALCFYISLNQTWAQSALSYIETKKDGIDGVTGLSSISDVVVSSDGKFVYTAAYSASSITCFERNTFTGKLTFKSTIRENANGVTGITNAFSLILSPDNKNIYVASPGGNVTAFSRNTTTGALTFVNTVKTGTNGLTLNGFVSVSISPDGKWVYGIAGTGANTKGLAVFKRDQATGAISLLEQHINGTNGLLLDQDFNGTTSPIKNIATSSNGRWLYVTATISNTVTLFEINPSTGLLTHKQTVRDGINNVTGIKGASSLLLSPDGKYLYVSGQKDNAITYFQVNELNGELTYVTKLVNNTGGITSLQGVRSLAASPDGKFLYASAILSNAVTVFNRNASTGALTFNLAVVNGGAISGINTPSGLTTDPLSRNLYVTGQSAQALVVFGLPVPAVLLSLTEATTTHSVALNLDPALEIYDADSQNLKSATVKIGSGFVNTDMLSVTLQNGISASYDANTGTLQLSGVASLNKYQEVLRTLQYKPGVDTNAPVGSFSERVINISILDEEDNRSSEVAISVKISGTLPVSFGTFTVSKLNNKAKLSWNTLSEQNSKHFTVYRSNDGITYKEIAQVTAQGNSNSSSSYTVFDNNPLNGTNYYQLKQTDIDGKVYDLDLKTLNFSLDKATVQAWPNPVNKLLNVSFKAGSYQQLQLTSISGQILVNEVLAKTDANTSISMEAYPKGLYILTLIGKESNYSLRIIK